MPTHKGGILAILDNLNELHTTQARESARLASEWAKDGDCVKALGNERDAHVQRALANQAHTLYTQFMPDGDAAHKRRSHEMFSEYLVTSNLMREAYEDVVAVCKISKKAKRR